MGPLLLAFLVAAPARADYLEVRRAATVKEQPDGGAPVRQRAEPGAVFLLASSNQTNGYYRVTVGGFPPTGWIYRTLVRRHAGDPPPGTIPAGRPDVDFPPPAPGPILPADAPVDVSAFRPADCPPEGDAKFERVREVNRFKNRVLGPRPSQVQRITMDDLRFPGPDQSRWSNEYAVELEALVVDVKPGGKETCNCHASAVNEKDTHIELAMDLAAGKTERVVVEVTPAWRGYMASRGEDWSTAHLRQTMLGRWVRIRGWMMFDTEHEDEAENTAPGRPNNWRATAWEIHPISSIEVLPIP
jgi:hypothetical protein